MFVGVAASPGQLFAAALDGAGPAATLLRVNSAGSVLTSCRRLGAAPVSMSDAASGLWLVGPASPATNASAVIRYSSSCAPQATTSLVGAVQVVAVPSGAWVLQASGSAPTALTFLPVTGRARSIARVLPAVGAAAFDVTPAGVATVAGQLGDGSVVAVTVNTVTGKVGTPVTLPRSGKPSVAATPAVVVGLQNPSTGGLVTVAGGQAQALDVIPANSSVVAVAGGTRTWVVTASSTPGQLGVQLLTSSSAQVAGASDTPWLAATRTGAWLASGSSLFSLRI